MRGRLEKYNKYSNVFSTKIKNCFVIRSNVFLYHEYKQNTAPVYFVSHCSERNQFSLSLY